MNDLPSSPVSELMDRQGVAYETLAIPLDAERKPVRSLEQLLAGLDRDPGQIVRSLVFRTGAERFVLLAVAGGGRADWAVLRKHLNERRLTMAEPAEVLAATGYPIGAVPPIALPEQLTVLVDQGVFDYPRLVIGSGVLGYAFDLECEDLRRLLGEAEVGNFVKA